LLLTSALAGDAFEAKGSGLLPAKGSLAPELHWLLFQESSSAKADGLLSKLSSKVVADGLNGSGLESLNSVERFYVSLALKLFTFSDSRCLGFSSGDNKTCLKSRNSGSMPSE
jgi:hypothetical protein